LPKFGIAVHGGDCELAVEILNFGVILLSGQQLFQQGYYMMGQEFFLPDGTLLEDFASSFNLNVVSTPMASSREVRIIHTIGPSLEDLGPGLSRTLH
jgi:hypothetical protein